MTSINKELYDALIAANVPDDKATAAAKSDVSTKEDIADLKARLAIIERLQWVILAAVIGMLIKAFLSL